MFYKIGSLTDSQPKMSTNLFRLAAVLCMFYVINPGFTFKQQKADAAEHGIGGGVISETISAEDGIMLTSAAFLNDATHLLDIQSAEAIIEPELKIMSRALHYDFHTVKIGENISALAVNFGLNQDTIISVNKITNTRLLQTGKVLRIPNQDGILHNVRNGDTLISIAERYKADQEAIQTANELFSDKITAGTDLFIPGARLDWVRLQEINGDLFIWPINGVITSPYGYRRDPFNAGRRQFHTGIDIRGSHGIPVRAAMSGRVSQIGFDGILGNYVVISHHSGYRTLYAHLSTIRTRNGAYVATGERIGDVGSTGLSTGPHLHFTVYKNGATVNPRALMR